MFFFCKELSLRRVPCAARRSTRSSDEGFNKPLADLRIVYERKGKDALPDIREVIKTSTCPAVIQRAANYLVDLDDRESIRQMESMLLDLVKQVAFTTFGLGTRWISFPPVRGLCLEKIWTNRPSEIESGKSMIGLTGAGKDEVPYILSALKDPHLDERMATILNKEEDHQLMQAALEALIVDREPSVPPLSPFKS